MKFFDDGLALAQFETNFDADALNMMDFMNVKKDVTGTF